jgi:uncharacterized protein
MHDARKGVAIGRVVGLWRYPVKSMAPEPVSDIDVSWHGFSGDRRWAFIRNEAVLSGFSWLTLRERADMNQYRPAFVDPSLPDKSPLVVHSPSGRTFDVTDPALAEELYPSGTRAIKQDRGIFDTFPLSLVTTQTLERLGEMTGTRLDAERFRPNILVETADGTPFAEDGWVGSVLSIGGLRMRVDKRDGRCAVITIDPETAQRDPAILKTVAREREGCIGVYGTTVMPGRIVLNDAVSIESAGS